MSGVPSGKTTWCVPRRPSMAAAENDQLCIQQCRSSDRASDRRGSPASCREQQIVENTCTSNTIELAYAWSVQMVRPLICVHAQTQATHQSTSCQVVVQGKPADQQPRPYSQCVEYQRQDHEGHRKSNDLFLGVLRRHRHHDAGGIVSNLPARNGDPSKKKKQSSSARSVQVE